MIASPDGKLMEIFEDREPYKDFKKGMLAVYLASGRIARCQCISASEHRCYHRNNQDGTCDVETCEFGCKRR